MNFCRRLVAVTILIGTVNIGAADGSGAAALRVEDAAIDAGIVGFDERITGVFRIQNPGDAETVIDGIATSCACSASPRAPVSIPGGQALELRVTCASGSRERRRRDSVILSTSEPGRNELELTLAADVREHFALDPDRVVFPQVMQGRGARYLLELRQLSTTPIRSVSLDTSQAWLVATKRVLPDTGKTRLGIELRVTGDAPLGQHLEVLSVSLEQAGVSVIDVPVFVDVVAAPGS